MMELSRTWLPRFCRYKLKNQFLGEEQSVASQMQAAHGARKKNRVGADDEKIMEVPATRNKFERSDKQLATILVVSPCPVTLHVYTPSSLSAGSILILSFSSISSLFVFCCSAFVSGFLFGCLFIKLSPYHFEKDIFAPAQWLFSLFCAGYGFSPARFLPLMAPAHHFQCSYSLAESFMYSGSRFFAL